jgi:hypothetical protein
LPVFGLDFLFIDAFEGKYLVSKRISADGHLAELACSDLLPRDIKTFEVEVFAVHDEFLDPHRDQIVI